MNSNSQYGVLTSELEGVSDMTVLDGRIQAAAKQQFN